MSDESVNPPNPSAATSPAERAAIDELIGLQHRVALLRGHFDAPPNGVQPHSDLDLDDQATTPYQLSYSAWTAISHGIDNIIAAYDMTVVQTGETRYSIMTRPYAVYPLLRAAFENSLRGLWLLGHPDRQVRVERRLRLQMTDAIMHDEAAQLAKLATKGEIKKQEREYLKPLAVANGTSMSRLQQKVVNEAVVRDGSRALSGNPDTAVVLWRCMSGLTHGDMWAGLALLDREEVAVSADGTTVTLLTTTPSTIVASLLSLCVGVTESVLEVLDVRRASPSV